MGSTLLHICLETDSAPRADEVHELGERWICECGLNYVYRDGFNTMGRRVDAWFPAPPLPRPRSRRSVGSLLFGPRKG